jgi:hypothetical protein
MSRIVQFIAVITLATTACGGDASPKADAAVASVDAAPGTADAPSTTPDAAGATCTGAAYDPCTDSTQCTSGNCHLFGGAGLQICTQACSAQSPCPMQNGGVVPCNGMGICRPNAANACTR